jgi:elongation factor Ts
MNMAEITASMVKELRERTDAPMMDCKRALSEAAGDMAKAEELLRVKLGTKASKAASRVAAEGLVAVHISADQKTGAIVEVNCETDFVGKNDDFIGLVKGIADLVVSHNPANVEALSALPFNGKTVDEVRKDLIGKIGENMSIRRFVRTEAKGRLVSYIHGGAKEGVLLDITGGDDVLGKDIAMHITALKPKAVSRAEVSAELIAAERSVAEQKAAESGKPADIVAKMVEGSVVKFLKEVSLLDQPFVKDDKQSIEQLLKSKGANISTFTLYKVGDGIEKKVTDFAAEVAEAAAAAAAAAK